MYQFKFLRRTGFRNSPPGNSFWSLLFLALLAGALALTFSALRGGQVKSLVPPEPLPASVGVLEHLMSAANWQNRSFEGIFQAVLPGMRHEGNLPHWKDALQLLFNIGGGAKIGHPQTFFIAQLPLMYSTPKDPKLPKEVPDTSGDRVVKLPDKPQTQPGKPPRQLPGDPLVLIYNTHTGETYEKTDGLDRLPGKRGGVYLAAKALADTLQNNYGIKVVQSDVVHDGNFLMDNPYSKSYQTVSSILKQYPSIKLVIDVHRDAGVERKNSLVEINGDQVASTMLVVGTNARQNHPNWQVNYAYAQQLGKEINAKYPGLLRKIITKRGRYNQHLHAHAILVEIGSTQNSTEEAMKAAGLIADVLAEELHSQEAKK